MNYCLPQARLSVQRNSRLVTGTKTGAAATFPMSVPVLLLSYLVAEVSARRRSASTSTTRRPPGIAGLEQQLAETTYLGETPSPP
jgi:hypothetical protein